MSITVVKPGLQSTLQSRPRAGLRHQGVPASGAADPLSLALVNKLLGNEWDAPAIEATLIGPTLRFEVDCAFALAGAIADATLSDSTVAAHETLFANAGDELTIGSVKIGARVYIGVAGGFEADEVLGSTSTYLQAAFGGLQGRALQMGDTLLPRGGEVAFLQTPAEFRLPMTTSWGLRTCVAAETALLDESSIAALFDTNWLVDRRADRMGLRLEGPQLHVSSAGRMPSAGVVPGAIQCPEDGMPYVLSVDAGTVGGYPRIAQVARVDRHVLGQLRPGDHVRLLRREPDEAIAELRAKVDYWGKWLPAIDEIL